MNREQAESLLAEIMGDTFETLEAKLMARIDAAIAAKPIPPFVPPPPWVAGFYGAGLMVRHRGGLFYARRDTDAEPGSDESWLSLVNGFVGLAIEWTDDRVLTLRPEGSDGTHAPTSKTFAVPISRGQWNAGNTYQPGDRVTRGLEYEATSQSTGVDPQRDEGAACWRKVSRPVKLSIDDDGNMTNHAEPVGTIKPMMAKLFADLAAKHAGGSK